MMLRGRHLVHLAFGLLVAAAVALPAYGQGPWHRHYARALELIEKGKAEAARTELEKARALLGEPGLRLRTEGVNYVDYLPHLYLAVTAHVSGDAAGAREHFKRAGASGASLVSGVSGVSGVSIRA